MVVVVVLVFAPEPKVQFVLVVCVNVKGGLEGRGREACTFWKSGWGMAREVRGVGRGVGRRGSYYLGVRGGSRGGL